MKYTVEKNEDLELNIRRIANAAEGALHQLEIINQNVADGTYKEELETEYPGMDINDAISDAMNGTEFQIFYSYLNQIQEELGDYPDGIDDWYPAFYAHCIETKE